jgi:hypothetical protein
MKTMIGAAAAVALAAFTLMRAIGADAPNRPPGVGANEWAPISDTMGVVLIDQQMGASDAPVAGVEREGAAARRPVGNGAGGGAALISPISGYLMVKRGMLWQRLIVVEPVKGPGAAG